ncbi:ABC transporter ATP-binding protein [candidate division WOR-3 bacterium]|nr:ABC transporter ATP-binding protein [candidate division WOR-3 bacterium]
MFSHEEEKLGKIYDSRIVGRLFGFVKKDWWMMVLGGLMALILAGTRLVMPTIRQMAIDDYLFKVYRMIELSAQEASQYSDYVLQVNDSTYAIIYSSLRNLKGIEDPESRMVDKVQYYLLDQSKAEEYLSPETLERYSELQDGKYLIPYGDFSKYNKKGETFQKSILLPLRDADLKGLVRFSLFFVFLALGQLIFGFGQQLMMFFAGQRAMHRLRVKIFAHLQRLSVRFFDHNPVGRLVTRTTNDVEKLNQFFSDIVTSFFYDFFLLIGLIIYLPLFQNWRMALVLFAVVPPMAIVTVIFRRMLRTAFRKVRVRIARINAFLAENLSGIKVVQIFTRERKRLSDFNDINESYFRAHYGQIMVFAVFRPLIDFLAFAAVAAILWFGGLWIKIIPTDVTIGHLAAFLAFVEIFFQPIRDIAEKFQLLQESMASGERIFMLADEKEEAYEGRKLPSKIEGEIEFQDVWFAYNDDDWVLKDINFKVKPGERVAFVGATGAGKTSIINTLCRFYEIQKGKILVDGHDARGLDKKELRSRVGIVMQDVFLFIGDIETNIRLRSDISHERVEAAAMVTNADKFISKLPEGYKAPIQERGVNLSVGERQLLAFARALAINPSILILDEATSSVDTKTEALIQDAIHKLLEGRTALIIAHRLSTVRDADRIIVLDHGSIVEEGTHKVLMKKKGVYYGLYKLQFEHKI